MCACARLPAAIAGSVALHEPSVAVGGVESRLCDASMLSQLRCPEREYSVVWGELLELSCRYCPYGQPCESQPISDPLVESMQRVFEADVPYQCMHGLLAALILSVQFFLVKSDLSPGLLGLLSENRSLAPFPFYTLQYSLFANMVPLRLMLCDRSLYHDVLNVYVPRVHPEHTGKCGMVYSDRMLVYRCRSRHPYSSGRRTELLRGIQCAAADIDLDPSMSGKLEKYGARARAPADSCQSAKGMWREAMSDVHKCVLITIGQLLDFRPGQLVLDWGSGCGHKLSWAKALFDVDGVGLDIEAGAVAWAQMHSAGVFCHADGRRLGWIPDGEFDHVISYAALYHMSKVDQCHTGIHLLRKLKVGGRAYFGWNQAYSMAAFEWRACFANASAWPELPREDVAIMARMQVDFQAVEDAYLFPPTVEVAGTHYLYQYPAFSIILTRLA